MLSTYVFAFTFELITVKECHLQQNMVNQNYILIWLLPMPTFFSLLMFWQSGFKHFSNLGTPYAQVPFSGHVKCEDIS
jgi:hypothetical protein